MRKKIKSKHNSSKRTHLSRRLEVYEWQNGKCLACSEVMFLSTSSSYNTRQSCLFNTVPTESGEATDRSELAMFCAKCYHDYRAEEITLDEYIKNKGSSSSGVEELYKNTNPFYYPPTLETVLARELRKTLRGFIVDEQIHKGSIWHKRNTKRKKRDIDFPTEVNNYRILIETLLPEDKPRHTRKLNLYEKQNGLCVLCDRIMRLKYAPKKRDFSAATFEHDLAKVRGGSDGDENVLLSCSLCNNKKGALTIKEYKERETNGHSAIWFSKDNQPLYPKDCEQFICDDLYQHLYIYMIKNDMTDVDDKKKRNIMRSSKYKDI